MYTIREAKEIMKDGIRTYLCKEENDYILPMVNCLPFYLEGPPGIGKTEIVRQIANEMEIGYVNFSLVHHTRNTLLGLPVIKDIGEEGKYTEFTMSEIIAAVQKEMGRGKEEGILLLDEFPCMSESIMPAMLSFLQNRNIGNYSLGRGWVIVLCGNPAQYNKQTKKFDAAIMDRIRRIEIEFCLDDFMEYASERKLEDEIITYLKERPDHLYRCNMEKDELVTCRGWENLSHTIRLYDRLGLELNEKIVDQFIKSEEIAYSFMEYYKTTKYVISAHEMEKVIKGKDLGRIASKCNKYDFGTKWNIASHLMGKERDELKELGLLDKLVTITEATCKSYKEQMGFGEGYSCDAGGIRTINSEALDMFEVLPVAVGLECLSEMYINEDTIFEILGDLPPKIREIIDKDVFCLLLANWQENINFEKIIEAGMQEDRETMSLEIINELEGWIELNKKEVKKLSVEISNDINNIFKFIELIDDEGVITERLFLEISKKADLLKAVVKGKSQNYKDLCKKYYKAQ